MTVLSRVIFLVASLSLGSLVSCQTVVVNGNAVDANETNVPVAAEEVGGELLLTDAILAKLTDLDLEEISSFQFGDADSVEKRSHSGHASCKTMPGDFLWPGEISWKVFNLLTGGALIKTVPIGAVCYEGEHYDASKCAEILENWTSSDTHDEDPTSNMYPLFDGSACLPQNAGKGKCKLGGLPAYSVNATTVSQIQLAVNFARSLNLRLVVRNTGHDFLGKSTGAGSLNIWTHNLKKVEFVKNYQSASGGYSGPAFKIGAGIQVFELYEAANKAGYTAVGGECRTVGVAGGYTAMGGHSPMSPIAGLGSDQVLSIDIVTPDGRFITADEEHNPDVFWAVRGGGGATFGVVTALTVRVWPKMTFSGVTWTLATAESNMTKDIFWKGMRTYWTKFPEFSDNHTYGYSTLFNFGGDYTWSMAPWLVPGMELPEFKAMISPLLKEWDAMGFKIKPEFFTHDNFYDTWKTHFPTESVGTATVRTGSRLIPRKNWADEELLNKTMDTLQGLVEDGSALINYNINGAAPENTPESALNPAWRDVVMYSIIGSGWDADNSTPEEVLAANKKVTNDWMKRLRDITPGSGGYGNEGDVMEPDFGQSFYGAENYKRLYALKQKMDPWGVFYAPTAVGSEDWTIEEVPGLLDGLLYSDLMKTLSTWLTLQTGRLCRK